MTFDLGNPHNYFKKVKIKSILERSFELIQWYYF